MQRAAAATLPRFDTGYWSYYALPHDPSPLDYHEYVVQLLQRLKSADPRFADAAGPLRGVREATACVPARARIARRLDVLALEAVDRFGRHRRRAVAARHGRRRLAHALVGPAEASRGLPVHAHRDRLGREPCDVRRAPDRARDLHGREARDTISRRSGTRPAATVVPRRREPHRPVAVGGAAHAGLHLVRIDVTWPAGATAPDPALVAALQQMAPVDTVVRACRVAASGRRRGTRCARAIRRGARAVCAALHAIGAGARTAATDTTGYATTRSGRDPRARFPDAARGSQSTAAPTRSERSAALAGIDADVVAFRPAAPPGKGLWTLAISLSSRTRSRTHRSWSTARPRPMAAALKTAACAPGVSGVLLDRLSDATRAGLSSAIATAQRGAFVCPGVTAEAQPFEIQYPDALTQPSPSSLNCNRDCLYLVTLDRADGRPVVARRGQINGGPRAR